MKMIKLPIVILAFMLSSCTIMNKQVGYISNSQYANNPCYNDSCDLKNMLEMLRLTKPAWAKINFEDGGVEELHAYAKIKLPQLISTYNMGHNNHLTEQKVFEKLIITVMNDLSSSKYKKDNVPTQSIIEKAIDKLNRLVFGN